MKKLINRLDDVLAESLRGFARAHADLIHVRQSPTFVVRATAGVPGKVALVSGGGSGHEPMHVGFVGRGMLDAACPGEIFTAPTPDQIVAAARAVETGAGVLFLVKNFAGDVMNFEVAAEMLDRPHAVSIVVDDVATAGMPGTQGRGVAGTLVVEKLVGAAAERGASLGACKDLADQVIATTGSMGVALTSCTVPATGRPTFELGAGEMELGVGIHGEPGRRRVELQPADTVAEEMVGVISHALALRRGDAVLLVVNGLGATPLLELYLMLDAAARRCEQRGLTVVRSLAGNHCTSLDMAGCSITLSRFDALRCELWDAPVHTPALRWGTP
jgi:dihydroxyacetone kinase-like protein